MPAYCAENVSAVRSTVQTTCMLLVQDHTCLFVDGRIANKTVGSIKSKDKECGEYTNACFLPLLTHPINYFLLSGVRSLQFNSDILTVGTGGGNVFFYDLRNGKYLSAINSSSSNACNDREHLCCLKTSPGWMVSELEA